MKRGFTLLEMLIVIGIIAVLTAATLAGYSHILRAGEHARAHELVSHVATALTALFDNDGVWPKKLRDQGAAGGKIDENIAYYLKDRLSITVDGTSEKAIGYDRFGLVTPWATAVIKRLGSKASLSSRVNGSSTIDDHILHFAIDLDGDGLIENISIGGQGAGSKSSTISVRATAIVWCCDQDGKIVDYATGSKKDGIYSWAYGQTQAVK